MVSCRKLKNLCISLQRHSTCACLQRGTRVSGYSPRVIARRNDVAIPYLQSGFAYRGLPRCARNDARRAVALFPPQAKRGSASAAMPG